MLKEIKAITVKLFVSKTQKILNITWSRITKTYLKFATFHSFSKFREKSFRNVKKV